MGKITLLTLLALGSAMQASAQPVDVDWKYFGTGTLAGQSVVSFYESVGAVQRPNGHIEVWTKGLRDADIRRFQKTDKGFVKRVASKLKSGYELPYASVAKADNDAKITVMVLEDAANNSNANPVARMLIEFDCAGRTERALSVYFSLAGKEGSSDTPREWSHIPPETSVDTLMKILCPRQ